MVKVAFVFYNFEVGGTELNAVRTAEALDPERFDVRILTLSGDGPLLERCRDSGIPTRVFPVGSLMGPGVLREGARLVEYLRDEGVDVVHAFDIFGNIFAIPCARLAGVPLVLGSRRWWKRSVRGRVLRAHRFACRFAHRVVANSDEVGRFLVEEDGVPPDRVTVITNFLEEEAFAAPDAQWLDSTREELRLRAADLVVGCVARLVPVKDHVTLLRAFASVLEEQPNARLVLVGDGPEGTRLESLADELGVRAAVRFAGRRPRSPSCHHLFDVSALTSTSEGFPNTVLEAMAAGRPVVATRVGGTADAVRHGETGLLVPPGNVEMLTAALDSLLRNADLRKRMGAGGRQRALAVFAQDRVLARIEELYAGAVSTGPTASSAGSRPGVAA